MASLGSMPVSALWVSKEISPAFRLIRYWLKKREREQEDKTDTPCMVIWSDQKMFSPNPQSKDHARLIDSHANFFSAWIAGLPLGCLIEGCCHSTNKCPGHIFMSFMVPILPHLFGASDLSNAFVPVHTIKSPLQKMYVIWGKKKKKEGKETRNWKKENRLENCNRSETKDLVWWNFLPYPPSYHLLGELCL